LLTHNGDMVAAINREPDVFTAISHRARRQMLDLLTGTERSVGDIAARFEMSRPAVSQHLRILLDAGLVTEQRHGRERRYRLVPAGLGPVRNWIAHYEQFWDEHLQRLQKTLAKRVKNDESDSKRDSHSAAAGGGVAGDRQ
jgi:DNA-binding transcriptional ArsR family regulator